MTNRIMKLLPMVEEVEATPLTPEIMLPITGESKSIFKCFPLNVANEIETKYTRLKWAHINDTHK